VLTWRSSSRIAAPLLLSVAVSAQQAGSIRGVVYDKDFESPVAGATVLNVDTNQKVTTSDQGNYSFPSVQPGKYTLVFAKEGYVRQLETDVIVVAGQLTDLNVWLAGDFVEMEEYVVQDTLQLAPGSEAALLKLRLDSPSLIDSVGADLMSRAGASDAASALRLVSGASLQDGKFAVIRGLPDRYVSSQLNGIRLPSADEDTRAVELDQFPAAAIESIQVSKTFTPDQQGDASGGAVNVVLKGVPDRPLFINFKGQTGYNDQVTGRNDFLSYKGGGVGSFGRHVRRGIQTERIGESWLGAVGVSEEEAPIDYKWALAGGGSHEFDNGIRIGGYATMFYERESSFFDNGVDDSYWVERPGAPLTPRTSQGSVSEGEFKTALFDVTQGTQAVQWGVLATGGIEFGEHHDVNVTYLYTNTSEDTATLAEDTRGKEYFFPGYDPNDPSTPGHSDPDTAPYLRFETLDYQKRTTQTVQVHGHDEFPLDDRGTFRALELDWSASNNRAELYQPDKRQFGSEWTPERQIGPPSLGLTIPPTWSPFKPAANFTLGNLQRIWERIDETSEQYTADLKLRFEQWSGVEGYLKTGVFYDSVVRQFDQETFSNFGDNSSFEGHPYEEFWSASFPYQNHPITESDFDVDYDGDQRIAAWYAVLDLPLTDTLKVIGGFRFESTEIGMVNDPDPSAVWFPPGGNGQTTLRPGDADVDFEQDDWLPAISLVYEPIEEITLRASYTETVARQTFKELSPILQQEFLGGPIFIGNPDLEMSSLKNYDIRLDYRPYDGGLFSVSYFYKDIEDPIEYVQRLASNFDYTTAVNYPHGELSGFEFETRQSLGEFWEEVEGLSIGGNATLIDSRVTLTNEEKLQFRQPNIQAPLDTRPMTNAPEYLYNVYLTYELARTGTQASIFYTVQGDTLLEGAAVSSPNFVPSLYQREFGTLNVTLRQQLGEHFTFQFQAKNLTNPRIETEYRSQYIANEEVNTSFTRGREYTFSIGGEYSF